MNKPELTAADLALANHEAGLRSDSRWLELPLELRRQIFAMEQEGVRRSEMLKLIKARGFQWSAGRLSEFFKPVNREAAELRKAAFAANQLADAAAEGGDLAGGGQAKIAKAFLDAITGAIDPTSPEGQALLLSAGGVFAQMQKATYDTARLKLDEEKKKQKDKEIELVERRIAALEKKVADAKQVVAQSKLTAEEQRARLKEILK